MRFYFFLTQFKHHNIHANFFEIIFDRRIISINFLLFSSLHNQVSRILKKKFLFFSRVKISIHFFLFIEISYLKFLFNLSRYVVAIEYNLKSFLIELSQTIINTINIFIRFLELIIVAIN